MQTRWIPVLAAIAVLALAGGALATHVAQVDPAVVPTGFLAAHNAVRDVPVSALARAVTPNGTDAFIQHVTKQDEHKRIRPAEFTAR